MYIQSFHLNGRAYRRVLSGDEIVTWMDRGRSEEGPGASVSTSISILSISFFESLHKAVDCCWPRRALALDFWF